EVIIRLDHGFRKVALVGCDTRDGCEIGFRMHRHGGGHVEVLREFDPFNHAVVAHDATLPQSGIEQDGVEADETFVTDDARAVYDGTMRNGNALTDGDRCAVFGVDHHAVLNVRTCADDHGGDFAVFVGFVGTNHRVRADENIVFHDDFTAQNGG